MNAMIIPSRYRDRTTGTGLWGKKTEANSTRTGNRALQPMKGIMRATRRRSWKLSSILVAYTAGTLHPKPITRGTNAFPGRPTAAIRVSITKAMRAIIPLYSIKPRTR